MENTGTDPITVSCTCGCYLAGSHRSSENRQKGFASKYIEGNISKDMKLEHIGSALQKIAEGVKAVHRPTFSDAETG